MVDDVANGTNKLGFLCRLDELLRNRGFRVFACLVDCSDSVAVYLSGSFLSVIVGGLDSARLADSIRDVGRFKMSESFDLCALLGSSDGLSSHFIVAGSTGAG